MAPSTQFGSFAIVEHIATGGMAEVWLAYKNGEDQIGRFCVIKKILPQLVETPGFVERFKDEAKITLALSHSNIVTTYEYGKINESVFLVMDYIKGIDLRMYQNRIEAIEKAVSPAHALYIIEQIANGLAYAQHQTDAKTGQSLNVIHRDLKPKNIMLSFEGEVKIIDFGIASFQFRQNFTQTGEIRGSFSYMSPEQVSSQPLDQRTDIFSLGICLWELLTGKILFSASDYNSLIQKIKVCDVAKPSQIRSSLPKELDGVVMKALAKNPNDRYSTAQEFSDAIRAALHKIAPGFSSKLLKAQIKKCFSEEIEERNQLLSQFLKGQHLITESTLLSSTLDHLDLGHNSSSPVNLRSMKLGAADLRRPLEKTELIAIPQDRDSQKRVAAIKALRLLLLFFIFYLAFRTYVNETQILNWYYYHEVKFTSGAGQFFDDLITAAAKFLKSL